MSVAIFIGRDLDKHTHFPGTSHESYGVREVCRYLWETWQHDSSRHYAIVANPKKTITGSDVRADMIIISQLGLGVLELKHHFGQVDCSKEDGPWRAGPKVVHAGSDNNNFQNPRQQVQSYARQLHNDLLQNPKWLPGPRDEPKTEVKLNTAVCFTNPYAVLHKCKEKVEQHYDLQPWETSFDVLAPKEIREWAADLRFQLTGGRKENYEAYEWTAEEVNEMAKEFFGARKWKETTKLMPPIPFGYLTIIEQDKPVHAFALYNEENLVGREPTVAIPVPEIYDSVSRKHACVQIAIDGVVITDEKSSNGSFVNDRKIFRHVLEEGDLITLGSEESGGRSCKLRFTRKPPEELEAAKTTIQSSS